MNPQLRLESLTFSDDTIVSTIDANIIAIVGPNNSGKSSTLKEIQYGGGFSERLGPVLKAVKYKKVGSAEDLTAWLENNVQKVKVEFRESLTYSWLGNGCQEADVAKNWMDSDIGNLNNILCNLINAEKRLEVANKQAPIDFFSEAPSHPMHVLFKNTLLEEKVNEAFKVAFKTDLILNRGGGKVIAFHVGERPKLELGEDGLSPSYFKRLQQLPFLHHQGHGMRSFAGCILHAFTSPAFIKLLDEPEAFLHPPHAKLLAGLLARSMAINQQLIVATHSGDFLRGLLDSNNSSLRVIRLTRDNTVNRVHELDANSIRTLWADPVLRFSNILDAIFHDEVLICEADSDCRFYSAILDVILEGRDEIAPDIMFAATGGKDRMPVHIQALRRLGVKIRVIADFDVLRDEKTLFAIVDSLGGDVKIVEPLWQQLKTNVQSQTPPLSTLQVKEQISFVLDSNKSASLTNETIEKIKQALKATSPWHFAKLTGVNALASGQPRIKLNELLTYLKGCGLFVVNCGEIERFAASIGGHGPKWVAQVLTKDIAHDTELENARQFIAEVFDLDPKVCVSQPSVINEGQTQPSTAIMEKSDAENSFSVKRPRWKVFLKKIERLLEH